VPGGLGVLGAALLGVTALVAVVATTDAAPPLTRETPSPAPHPPIGPVLLTQIPARSSAPAAPDANPLPAGSRIVRFDPAQPDASPVDLTADFLAAGRPDVSFDGRHFLFVGRRAAGDPFDVWEMSVDGGEPRRITRGTEDCRAAIYLSTIYTIDASAPSEQIAFCRIVADARVPSLYTCRMDGTHVRRIVFTPDGAWSPHLLGDGRLLFSSAQPPVTGQAARGSALFTVNTDGTDVFVFADAHAPAARRAMARETPDGHVVYVEAAPDARDGGGSLVTVKRTASLGTRSVLAHDPAGVYRSPFALDDGRLLVSHRSGPDAAVGGTGGAGGAGAGTWGLFVLDPRGDSTLLALHDAPEWHEVDAVVVRPRRAPPGRSSVVDDRRTTGLLYCLDASMSDAAHAPRRTDAGIAWVEVYRALDGDGLAPGVTPTVLLGTAPVEPDGSFHLRVPARMPIRLQTLDAERRPVLSMRNWIWVMPREARGCIGCHEDRELSPPNRHVLALRKAAVPIGLDEPGGAGAATGDAP